MSLFARRLQSASVVSSQQAGGYGVGWTITTSNVGLASLGINGSNLPLYTGPSEVPAGTTISDMRIDSPMLVLSAGNITIQRCLIQPTSVAGRLPSVTTTNYNTFVPVPNPVTIKDCDIDGTLLSDENAAWATGFLGIGSVINCYIHHFGTGINFMGTGVLHSALVEHNYVTDLVGWGNPATTGNHSDGFTIRDFDTSTTPTRTCVVRNNRIDCDSPNATGAYFIQAWAGHIGHSDIENNLLEGNGYQLILEANGHGYSNMNAINNRMTGTGFGAGYVTGGPGWTVQQENYLYNAGNQDGKGAPVSF